MPDEFAVYGDHAGSGPPPGAPPVSCPFCGSTRFEDGFVDSASEGQVRYFSGAREQGIFGVRRFGLERRAVIARRCLGCNRLDLFAGDVA